MVEKAEDPLVRPTISVESVPVGAVETPVVTVSQVPMALSVGDKVTPKVNVKRADGTTAIENCPVDFFVIDTLGVMALGDRVLTDANGDAEATADYYVGSPDAGGSIDFIIVTRRIVV